MDDVRDKIAEAALGCHWPAAGASRAEYFLTKKTAEMVADAVMPVVEAELTTLRERLAAAEAKRDDLEDQVEEVRILLQGVEESEDDAFGKVHDDEPVISIRRLRRALDGDPTEPDARGRGEQGGDEGLVARCQLTSPTPWGSSQCALAMNHDGRHSFSPSEALPDGPR